MNETLTGLFAGKITFLPPDGERTAIFKTPIKQAQVDKNGITIDNQADKHEHGGPEKALHQYAQTSYDIIKAAYPRINTPCIAGAMGENLSAPNMDEHSVNIGDIYRIGEILVQVAQPRNPCWKIAAKFDERTLPKFVDEHHINGWYYRVLKDGQIKRGDEFALIERPSSLSVYEFLRIVRCHRPSKTDFATVLNLVGLTPTWHAKLIRRRDYLYG